MGEIGWKELSGEQVIALGEALTKQGPIAEGERVSVDDLEGLVSIQSGAHAARKALMAATFEFQPSEVRVVLEAFPGIRDAVAV